MGNYPDSEIKFCILSTSQYISTTLNSRNLGISQGKYLSYNVLILSHLGVKQRNKLTLRAFVRNKQTQKYFCRKCMMYCNVVFIVLVILVVHICLRFLKSFFFLPLNAHPFSKPLFHMLNKNVSGLFQGFFLLSRVRVSNL